MTLAIRPPLQPMLARLERTVPEGAYLYEPKWDGLRCLVFRDEGDIDLRSRNDRPFARYFPELLRAFSELPERRFVFDGEIVVVSDDGFDFEALLSRLHPAASRVEALSRTIPARFVAFDTLAVADRDLTSEPFTVRRTTLEKIAADRHPPLLLTRITEDIAIARSWLDRYNGGGIDGVIAKHSDLTYQTGKRAMVKVKSRRTAMCVAAGFRVYETTLLPSSILLGLYEGDELLHIGVASGFGKKLSRDLVDILRSNIVPIESHPWSSGFGPRRAAMGRLPGAASRWDPREMDLDWVPLRPDLVCEVSYEQADRRRLRHPARFIAWLPDVDTRECAISQLNTRAIDLSELIA